MPAPSGVTVEVEFTAGVWTDVTGDVDWTSGLSLRVGRQTKLSQPSASVLNLTMRNPTGKYTPGLQMLTDGTVNPRYPNVVPNKRIRYSNASGVRFLGLVQSWQPSMTNGVLGSVAVQAIDSLDRLSRAKLLPAFHVEVLADAPIGFWPMTDQAGSTSAAAYSGRLGDLQSTWTGLLAAPGAPIAFGNGASVTGADGTAALFAPDTSAQEGYFLQTPYSGALAAFTIETWVKVGSAATASASFVATLLNSTQDIVYGGSAAQIALLQSTSGQAVFGTTSSSATVGPDLRDGHFHHLVMTIDAGGHQKQYIDGAAYGGTVSGALTGWRPRLALFGGLGFGNLVGTLGPVAIYDTALSAARIAAHYNAGTGWFLETVDQRISRILQLADIDPADLDLDPSTVTLNGYQQGGKDALSAAGDAVSSEGGSAVLYQLAGSMTFRGRHFRAPAAPAFTVDVDRDGDRSVQAASIDTLKLVNTASVSRQAGGSSLETVTAKNDQSITDNGEVTGPSITSWAHLTDLERPTYVAQEVVSSNGTPRYAFDQLAVDLLTAEHNLYAAVQAAEIGTRVRVTSLPAGAAPATQLDLTVEGWTERVANSVSQVVFDTSAADSPAWGVADDAVYGRAQSDGTNTLHADITAAAASLQADVGGLWQIKFTTNPAAYPLKIRVGGEVLTVTAAPGASLPQTLAVTRGVDGTYPAPHTAGTRIDVEPQATAVL